MNRPSTRESNLPSEICNLPIYVPSPNLTEIRNSLGPRTTAFFICSTGLDSAAVSDTFVNKFRNEIYKAMNPLNIYKTTRWKSFRMKVHLWTVLYWFEPIYPQDWPIWRKNAGRCTNLASCNHPSRLTSLLVLVLKDFRNILWAISFLQLCDIALCQRYEYFRGRPTYWSRPFHSYDVLWAWRIVSLWCFKNIRQNNENQIQCTAPLLST